MLGLDIYPTSSIYHAWIGYLSYEQYIPCLDWIYILRVIMMPAARDVYILRVVCIIPGIDIYPTSSMYHAWNGYLSYAYLISKSSTSIH